MSEFVVKDKSALPFCHGWTAWIEETGTEIKGHQWGYLKQLVGKHLDKHNLNVGDREAYLHKAVCIALAKAGKSGMCIKPYRVSQSHKAASSYDNDPRQPPNLKRGRHGYDAYSWKAIHLSAADGKLTPALMREFIGRIGCGSCRGHATRYMAKHPMPATDNFEWTVNFHSAVSKSIGKRVVGLDEAKAIWKVT